MKQVTFQSSELADLALDLCAFSVGDLESLFLDVGRALRHRRAGTVLDDSMGWCVSCGNSLVNYAQGDDTCRECLDRV